MFLSALSDPNDPTFFEMVMIQRTVESLRPAFDHALRAAAAHSGIARAAFPWADELFATATAAVEAHYLWNYDGSFGEYFFNLKRVKLEDDWVAQGWGGGRVVRSLFTRPVKSAADRQVSAKDVPIECVHRRRSLFG